MGLIALYTLDMLAYVVVALFAWLALRTVYLMLRRSRSTARKEIVLGLSVLYCVGLLSQTVLPPGYYGFENGALCVEPIIRSEKQYNLVPARSIVSYVFGTNDQVGDWDHVAQLNLFGNVFLFVPFGLLAPLCSERHKGLWRTASLGLVASLAIEAVQFFLGRSADIDDVVLNTLGVILGYLAYTLIARVVRAVSSPRTR